MTSPSRSAAVTALLWSTIESIAHHVIAILIAVVLARLLTPEDFGLMGMLAIFIALATLIVEGGMTSAIIQKRELTEEDVNTAFLVNISSAVCIAAVMALGARFIAEFFGEPQLESMLTVLAAVFVIHGLAAIQIAQMTRQLKFKALVGATIAGLVASGIISIAMAAYGFGVWSLVAQQVSFAAFRMLFLWLIYPWRPSWQFSSRSFRALFSYGSRILLAAAMERISSNLYLVAIGKAYGAYPLGLYTRAKLLQEVPVTSLSNIVGRVTYPVFSRLQDEPVRLRRGMREAVTKLTMISLPMLSGIAVLAVPIIIVLLGEQWRSAAQYLQLLCIAGLFHPLNLVNLSLLKSVGRADLFLRLEVIKQALVFANIALTWRISIEAMLTGHAVLSAASFFINARYAHRLASYGIRAQLLDVAPYAGAAMVMVLTVFTASSWVLQAGSSMIELMILVPLGVIVYSAVCLIFRLEAFMDVLSEVRQRILD